MSSVVYNPINGRLTIAGPGARYSLRPQDASRSRIADNGTGDSYEGAKPQEGSNHWSVTENGSNNARNVNFNNGNVNNNNKYNGNVVRAVAASIDYHDVPKGFIHSVWHAYADCLKGKRRSEQAVEYMQTAAADLPRLACELWTGEYRPGTSTCFLVRYPKLREVFAASFRDRIVHHWICLRLNPLFEERFEAQGNVSFNCRKGYGTDSAVQHAAEGMKRISDCYNSPAWVFRGDLVGFFMSIDKDLLWYLLERFILRWRKRYEREGWTKISHDLLKRLNMAEMPEMYWDILLRTTRTVVTHHPERDCVLNSPPEWWNRLEPNKSLFTSPTGEPIGNLTTQLFANFLMSFFVAYVQWLFRRQNYSMAQFVDDFEITCDNRRFLIDSIPKISAFLSGSLRLKMHADKRYLQPVGHGLLFVGTFIKPGRLYLGNRTRARLEEHCKGYGRMLADSGCTEADVLQMVRTLNSYLGFTRRRRSYKFRLECIDSMGRGLWQWCTVKGHYETVCVRRKYKPINIQNLLAA